MPRAGRRARHLECREREVGAVAVAEDLEGRLHDGRRDVLPDTVQLLPELAQARTHAHVLGQRRRRAGGIS